MEFPKAATKNKILSPFFFFCPKFVDSCNILYISAREEDKYVNKKVQWVMNIWAGVRYTNRLVLIWNHFFCNVQKRFTVYNVQKLSVLDFSHVLVHYVYTIKIQVVSIYSISFSYKSRLIYFHRLYHWTYKAFSTFFPDMKQPR